MWRKLAIAGGENAESGHVSGCHGFFGPECLNSGSVFRGVFSCFEGFNRFVFCMGIA